MRSVGERVATARATVAYLTERSDTEMTMAVPNCPGWTVYNAAVHVAKACYAWGEMIDCAPDDHDARDRCFATGMALPAHQPLATLAGWANDAIDKMDVEPRECYFSMTGGPGDTALWAWHAASELGVHQLDVEAALGHEHAITEAEAIDSLGYVTHYVTQALRTRSGIDPGTVVLEIIAEGGGESTMMTVPSDAPAPSAVAVRGTALQLLLALWGRPHVDVEVEVVSGDVGVWDGWKRLPTENIQFGTWD